MPARGRHLALPWLAVGALVVAACGGSPTSESHRLSDQAVCSTIDGDFFYPTIPATGKTVSLASAQRVESLLRRADAAVLRAQAVPLQQAITGRDAAKMVTVFNNLSNTICPALGIPPPT